MLILFESNNSNYRDVNKYTVIKLIIVINKQEGVTKALNAGNC